MTILFLLLGMAMLMEGGRRLVDAASIFAKRLGVPPLLVGLTLVAWGTSAPELALNLSAAFQDRSSLVFGNIVGANICNLGLVLGVCAIVHPLSCEVSIVRREMPLTLIMLGGMGLLALAPLPTPWHLGRVEGAVLLGAFLLYTIATIRSAYDVTEPPTDAAAEEPSGSEAERPTWLLLTFFFVGVALLTVGGNVASEAACQLARQLGMSDKTIGLTILAIGTTLPELATSVMAIRARQVDLAVGNALGSCLVNVGLVCSIATMIAPYDLPHGAARALLVMIGLAVVLVVMMRLERGYVRRPAGVILLAAYVASVAYELVAG